MAEENAGEVSPEVLAEAKQLGWAEKSEWRGDPAAWVDAQEFLQRGKTVLPMLQRNYERVQGDLKARDAETARLREELRATNAIVATLQESAEENAAAELVAAKAELQVELETALRDGDHKTAAELTQKIAEMPTEAPKKKEEAAGGGEGQRLDPEVVAWYNSNPEFIQSPEHVALANGVSVRLRAEGNKLMGKAFLDAVAERVEKVLGPVRGGTSKVLGGNGGGGRGGSGGSDEKSYSDLPADAKAACDRMIPRLVGEGKRYKSQEAWRKDYAKTYFKGA